MERLAHVYLSSRTAHPIRWQFIDLFAGAAMVVILWLVIGSTAGIVFAVVWCLFTLLGLFNLVARRRVAPRTDVRLRPDPPDGT